MRKKRPHFIKFINFKRFTDLRKGNKIRRQGKVTFTWVKVVIIMVCVITLSLSPPNFLIALIIFTCSTFPSFTCHFICIVFQDPVFTVCVLVQPSCLCSSCLLGLFSVQFYLFHHVLELLLRAAPSVFFFVVAWNSVFKARFCTFLLCVLSFSSSFERHKT